jgi:predicted secreted acid phosphatase
LDNKAIIVDIDGTLADCSWRLHFIQNKPKNWKAFFEGIPDDPVIEDMKYLVNAFYSSNGVGIIILTGRPENHIDATAEWLKKNEIPFDHLLMRKIGDFREDTIIKEEYLNLVKNEWGYNPILAIDDRKRILDMYQKNGLYVIDASKGHSDF